MYKYINTYTLTNTQAHLARYGGPQEVYPFLQATSSRFTNFMKFHEISWNFTNFMKISEFGWSSKKFMEIWARILREHEIHVFPSKTPVDLPLSDKKHEFLWFQYSKNMKFMNSSWDFSMFWLISKREETWNSVNLIAQIVYKRLETWKNVKFMFSNFTAPGLG